MNEILRRVFELDRIEQNDKKKKEERERIEASYSWNKKKEPEKKWWEL